MVNTINHRDFFPILTVFVFQREKISRKSEHFLAYHDSVKSFFTKVNIGRFFSSFLARICLLFGHLLAQFTWRQWQCHDVTWATRFEKEEELDRRG